MTREHTLWALVPREGLFCKDGRGWYSNAVGRSGVHSWPMPSTVRGALRNLHGQELSRRADFNWDDDTAALRLRHMQLLRRPIHQPRPFQPEDLLWPRPADAVFQQDRVLRLQPIRRDGPGQPQTLGTHDGDPALEALWHPRLWDSRQEPGQERGRDDKAVVVPHLFTTEDFFAWLAAPQAPPDLSGAAAMQDARSLSPALRHEIHVKIDPATGAAADELLFTSPILETLTKEHEWALGCWIEWDEAARAPASLPSQPVFLGGRRRPALAEALPSGLFDMPAALKQGYGHFLRLFQVTPAEFSRGWLPDGFQQRDGAYQGRLPSRGGSGPEVILRAALVGRPLDLSGWDMLQRRPRPTRRLVPAGAVYYFEKPGAEPFSDAEVENLWLAQWAQRTPANGQEDPSKEGYGSVVPGRWTPKNQETP